MTTKHLSVAIVDDQSIMRETSKTMIGLYGYQFHSEAVNGEDLLDQLSSCERLPDICLLDLNMPVMDGFETARNLSKNYPAIRILAYSLRASPDQVEAIKTCGAHGFLPKESSPRRWEQELDSVTGVEPSGSYPDERVKRYD